MNRLLHLDPFSGAAGDMFLGLLVDLGLAPQCLAELPEKMGLLGVRVHAEKTRRGPFEATHVHVVVRGQEEQPGGMSHEPPSPPRHGHPHPHDHGSGHAHEHPGASDSRPPGRADQDHRHGRGLAAMLAAMERASLPPRAASRAADAVRRLFAAEARVHGLELDQVHLHEAGADDALIDIAGTCLGLDLLQIDEVSCSAPLPLGGGTVHCAHGWIPLPAPAVVELLAGVPVQGGPVNREMITPTGAALLRAVVSRFGPLPAMAILGTGFGAGTRQDPELANALRGIQGILESEGPRQREVEVLECAMDDILPQDLPVLIDRLLAAGARDAMVAQVLMKKGRPGFWLTVLCDPELASGLARLLLQESPTLGVRRRRDTRLEWDRDLVTTQTPWGPVRIKRALSRAGRVVRGRPEFEDCRAAAEAAKIPVDEVRRSAQAAFDGPGPQPPPAEDEETR